MKIISIFFLLAILTGCVAGPPQLMDEQIKRLDDMKVYKVGTMPDKDFKIVGEVSAADCSGPGGSRLYGDEGKAIDILKMKAAALNSDAVINVECGSGPFVNNCWAAKICTGKAVIWK